MHHAGGGPADPGCIIVAYSLTLRR
jgi:hypothetical protein